MEILLFFILSFLGLLTFLFFIAIIVGHNRKKKTNELPMRQSQMFLLVKAMLPEDFSLDSYWDTQSFSYEDSKSLKYVQMPDNKAYWLDKNRIYYANLDNNGKFDPSDGRPTDMKNIPEKEVAKMLYIFNTLKGEGI